MYDNSNIAWSANQLFKMIGNHKIVFDELIQRGIVWDKDRKSLLIHSMIIGVPIPATYARRMLVKDEDGNEMKTYSILDGKNRLCTIRSFINDEFVLTNLSEVSFYDEVENKDTEMDINGMCFSDLPEELQERIRNVRINVIYFDDLNNTEVRELFKRLNNGKPLTAKNRALASCENLEEVLNVGDHEIFTEMLSEKALENKNQAVIVVKAWLMAFYEMSEISFESKVLNNMIETLEMTAAEKKTMKKVFDLMQDTHTALLDKKQKKVAKKLYTETHFVSLIPYFVDMVNTEENNKEDVMAEWLISFYADEWNPKATSVSETYNEVCASGANKTSAIVKRNEELKKSYDRFFNEDSFENEDVDEEQDEQEETIEKPVDEEVTETEAAEDDESEEKSEDEIVDEDTQDVEEYDGDPDMANLVDELLGQKDEVKLSDFWGD